MRCALACRSLLTIALGSLSVTLITVNGEMHLTFATPGRRVPLEFQHRFARVFPQVLATAAEPEQACTLRDVQTALSRHLM